MTEAEPFVSIIVPTYNGGQLLVETLSSCLKVKGVEIEILVIDDASTDGTPEIIAANYPEIKLHRLPQNSGSGAAGRNLGISLAKARYIKFLDHDDLLQPRGFKAECLMALQTDADIVMSRWGVVPIDEKGRFRTADRKLFTPPEPSRLIEAILSGESVPFTAAALYKRSFIADQRWEPEAAAIDDFDWFCRMASRGAAITRVDTISYYWRLHPHSLQAQRKADGSLFHQFMSIRYNVFRKVEARLLHSGQLSEQRKRLLARMYYTFTRFLARSSPAECLDLLRRIKALDPAFVVDAGLEPNPGIRRFIQLFGLPAFLAGYGLLSRLRALLPARTASRLRRLSALVPGRG